jgi:hypothetical protein
MSFEGKLKLAGLCTAFMAYPELVSFSEEKERTTLSACSPEMILGHAWYGRAQDIWSCGLLLAQLSRCKNFKKLGIRPLCDFALTTDSDELRHLLAVFQRLGFPSESHVLTMLPKWSEWSLDLRRMQSRIKYRPRFRISFAQSLKSHGRSQRHCCLKRALSSAESAPGWNDAEPLVGEEGVDLLHALTDLDMSKRPSATAALTHRYFELGKAEVQMEAESDAENMKLGRPNSQDGSSSSTWDSLCSDAFPYHLAEDLARERQRQIYRLTVIRGVSASLVRGGAFFPELCQQIVAFLFRRRHPLSDCMFPYARNVHKPMRSILNNWLVEVAWKYKIAEPALFFSVEIADAYLLKDPDLPRSRYQLLGVVALMVATKIVSADAPEPADMSYVTDNAYTVEEVKSFEQQLFPTAVEIWTGWGPFHFLAHYVAELGLSAKHFHAAAMCLERTLVSYELSRHSPSLLAAAACLCAAQLLKESGGEELSTDCKGHKLSHLCGRDIQRLQAVAEEVRSSFAIPDLKTAADREEKLASVRRKYSDAKYSEVSKLVKHLLPLQSKP